MSTAKLQPTASALACTLKRLTSTVRSSRDAVFFSSNSFMSGRNFSVVASSAASNALEVCVKASTTSSNKIGDCPFSQRVLLTLEEKHLPYDMKLIDLNNKPEWFLKLNPDGKVPILKLDEAWIADSDVITRSLELMYPNPPLGTSPENASVGSKVFATFIAFLRSKAPSNGTEQALLDQLTALNDHLKEHGPFVNGKEMCAVDLSLGPKLHHLEIALRHYKNWSLPDSLPYVKSYMKAIFSMESFVKTRSLPEDIIEGWRPKVMG